ncbi:MAG TPA: 30S ribosomal protein S8 [Candidatus Woesearchaeota archaeon]|nr:30S ribosomal protein S8 [Candidatus Woesearchaeota archaeon]
MMTDLISNALSKILTYDKGNKKECEIQYVSNMLLKVLEILQDNKYLGGFETVQTSKGRHIVVNLIGYINKCASIRPRVAVGNGDYTAVEKRYLPAHGFGIIIVSTPQGIMTHKEALEKNLGGRLIAYCY